ncbi:MAG TPA: D-Ala-D-Ala carboxypeptidase family metallohydrolase [Candidatus Tumulicola sp.]
MWRTDFLTALAGAALAGLSPAAVAAAVPSGSKRTLWLRREGYAEEILAPFTVDGTSVYAPGYREICWLMRDHAVPFAQGYVQFDINEIQVLYEVQQALALHGVHQPLVITSGYRTQATNEAIEGAARNSQHLYAKAVDMYVAGVSNRELFDTCWGQGASGGMGYYDDHVHLDSGTRRWWVGALSLPSFA